MNVDRCTAWLAALDWSDMSSLLTVLAPLLAIPIGAMTFYLRSIREQQIAAQADATRRHEQLDRAVDAVTRRVAENERDYTAKEDWLRESMWTRQGLERLAESFARVQGGLDAAPAAPPLRSAGLDSAALARRNGRHANDPRLSGPPVGWAPPTSSSERPPTTASTDADARTTEESR
ncbi:MAG: hypothetical protein HOP29_11105 [Phycisphaerales bacterium]|nr:hypothetical protein [Phycisphaerales bacterium]